MFLIFSYLSYILIRELRPTETGRLIWLYRLMRNAGNQLWRWELSLKDKTLFMPGCKHVHMGPDSRMEPVCASVSPTDELGLIKPGKQNV